MSQCDANKITRCLNIEKELENLKKYLREFDILSNVDAYLAVDDTGKYCTEEFVAIDFRCPTQSLELISKVCMDIEGLLDGDEMVSDVDLYVYLNTVEAESISLRLSVGVYESKIKEPNVVNKRVIGFIRTAFSGYL